MEFCPPNEVPVFVSIPVHEQMECVVDQAKNWAIFAPEAAIMFHVNSLAPFDDCELRANVTKVNHLAFVNPIRLRTGWSDGTLIRAHISNFHAAKATCVHFHRFAMDASNTLLARKGLEAHIMKFDAGYNMPVPPLPMALARPMIEDAPIWNMRLTCAHHRNPLGVVPCEGIWFETHKFETVLEFMSTLEGSYVTEEVYPVAVWEAYHGTQWRKAGNYILTPFEANLHITKDDVAAISDGWHRNTDLFGVKRVPREYNHPIRQLVRQLGNY